MNREKKYRPTIAIDFDGVIHKYSEGWKDGSIYDEPIEGALKAIKELMKDYSVFIFSTRSPWQIVRWLNSGEHYPYCGAMAYDTANGYEARVIPFWVKFWNKKDVLGVTRRKLPAMVYVDDRALKFEGDWLKTLNEVVVTVK